MGELPHNPSELARLAEQVPNLPNAATKMCDNLERHEAHYHGAGMQRRYCRGLKHKSKGQRGVPKHIAEGWAEALEAQRND